MSFIKNTKEYYKMFEEDFMIPDSFLDELPETQFEDMSKDFEDDDCGDSCTL